jgi:predicted lipid-binding transport protein (Tim44 family)
MATWFGGLVGGLYIGMVIILKKSVRNSKHLRALTLTF